jgi:hypothetical protein
MLGTKGREQMGVPIIWQVGSEGGEELWLCDAEHRHTRVLAVHSSESREVVDRWSRQAESVSELLEMLHLEGLLPIERYHDVMRHHDPLYAAACAMLDCLPHRRVGGQVEDPRRELYPLIERMVHALEPFVSDPTARAIMADALGTYWASWIGCYEHLDHEVNAARQTLNEVLTGASGGILVLHPGDLTLTPEAVRVMIGCVVETHPGRET